MELVKLMLVTLSLVCFVFVPHVCLALRETTHFILLVLVEHPFRKRQTM